MTGWPSVAREFIADRAGEHVGKPGRAGKRGAISRIGWSG